MANDPVKVLGRSLRKSNRRVETVKSRYGERFAIVEKARDTVMPQSPFTMNFHVPRSDNNLILDIETFKALAIDGRLLAGGGIRLDPPTGTGNTSVSHFPDAGHYTGGETHEITGQPPVVPGGAGNNAGLLTQDDLNFTTSAFPGNVYKLTKNITFTQISFFAEPAAEFYISILKTDDVGYGIESQFWTGNIFTGTYEGSVAGWHTANVNISFLAGDTIAFRFTNNSNDPTVYHDQSVVFFDFATYYGCNRYQFDGTNILTGTYGLDPDGTHGIAPSYSGKPIPQYAMMVAYAGTPPIGAEQVEEVPLGINGYTYGLPGFIFGTRSYSTAFAYLPGSLQVWINGLEQLISTTTRPDSRASIYENNQAHGFTFAGDVPVLEAWERITCSYIIIGA